MAKMQLTLKYKNLYEAIKKSDYNMRTVAYKVGLTYFTLRKRMLGVTDMEFDVMKKLSKLLGLSTDYLSK